MGSGDEHAVDNRQIQMVNPNGQQTHNKTHSPEWS